MTSLFITIDTEYESGFTGEAGPGSRRENFYRSIRCATPEGEVGIFYQLDVLDRHGLKGVFFVDPMPALLWGVGAVADVVGPIVQRGHDVQLHLHTEWLALAGAANPLGSRTGDNLKDFALEDQCRLIDFAMSTLMAAGAPRPVAFRAGNYGANDDTLRALARLGIAYDTSHCPGFAGSACAIGLGPAHRRPLRRCGVIEVPIGCIASFGRELRHAQLTALSSRELLAAIRHARAHELNSFTIVSHSFELLSRDRQWINKVVRARFEELCAGVARMRNVDTATYAQNPPSPAIQMSPRPVLPGSPWRMGLRVAEQAMVNALYGARR